VGNNQTIETIEIKLVCKNDDHANKQDAVYFVLEGTTVWRLHTARLHILDLFSTRSLIRLFGQKLTSFDTTSKNEDLKLLQAGIEPGTLGFGAFHGTTELSGRIYLRSRPSQYLTSL
jgi:hypothetical protein